MVTWQEPQPPTCSTSDSNPDGTTEKDDAEADRYQNNPVCWTSDSIMKSLFIYLFIFLYLT